MNTHKGLFGIPILSQEEILTKNIERLENALRREQRYEDRRMMHALISGHGLRERARRVRQINRGIIHASV